LAIFISLFYDLFFFGMMTNEYGVDQKYDGGMENTVRRFSLYMSYTSFFFRIIVALVFWKDSLDYDNIMPGAEVRRVMEDKVKLEARKN